MDSYKTKPPSDECRWISLYPAYINAKRTIAEGRRVPANKAVDNPTSQEMLDILKNAGFNVRLERKMYPRDPSRDMQFQGRVRVQLLQDDGNPVLAEFPTREAVMRYLVEMIPKLKSRQSKSGAAAATNNSGPTNTAQQQQQQTANKKKKR